MDGMVFAYDDDLLGTFHVIADRAPSVDRRELPRQLVGAGDQTPDFTTWGWVHSSWESSSSQPARRYGGATWARSAAVVVAMLSAIINVAFLASDPLWSVIMIGVDVLIIYARRSPSTATGTTGWSGREG